MVGRQILYTGTALCDSDDLLFRLGLPCTEHDQELHLLESIKAYLDALQYLVPEHWSCFDSNVDLQKTVCDPDESNVLLPSDWGADLAHHHQRGDV